MTEIFELKNGIALKMIDIFKLPNPSYNLRSSSNQFRTKHKLFIMVYCPYNILAQKYRNLCQIILPAV